MKTLLIVIACLLLAALGAWDSTRCRHRRGGKLPEDIQ